MIDVLCRKQRANKKLCSVISFGIGSSHKVGGGFYHSVKHPTLTNNENEIYKVCMHIFDKYYNLSPIRKVSISFGKLVDDDNIQLNIFENYEKVEKDKNINKAVDEIKERFGPNTVLKASSLLEYSTIKDRNKKIGGHNAE